MLLAKQGVDVNQATNDGRTPLYIASHKGHAEVVSMLLAKQGIDVNQARGTGATPLWIASYKGHAEVVSMLLRKQGIEVNQATNNGLTPLLIATQNGHAKVVKKLLANQRVDVNRADDLGCTPLRVAIDKETPSLKMVLMLLHDVDGVDINQADNRGVTPIKVALNRAAFFAKEAAKKAAAYENAWNNPQLGQPGDVARARRACSKAGKDAMLRDRIVTALIHAGALRSANAAAEAADEAKIDAGAPAAAGAAAVDAGAAAAAGAAADLAMPSDTSDDEKNVLARLRPFLDVVEERGFANAVAHGNFHVVTKDVIVPNVNATCGICLEVLNDRVHLWHMRECGHAFHDECMQRLIGSGGNATCPLCRKPGIDFRKNNIPQLQEDLFKKLRF